MNVRMKKHHIHFLLLFSFGVLLLALGACHKAAPSDSPHRVLVIHSWDSIGEEGQFFIECMDNAFKKSGMDVDVRHIYAKMTHRPGEVFGKTEWPKYAKAIEAWKPEVILLNDDPVVEWVLKDMGQDSLFVNTPMVFAGVNVMARDSLRNFPLMTGLWARIDFGRNINVIMRVMQAQNVVVELDDGNADSLLREQCVKVLTDTARFVDNSDFHLPEISDEYMSKNYPGKAAVHFVSCAKPYMNHAPEEDEAESQKWMAFFYRNAPYLCHLQVKNDIYSNGLINMTKTPQFTCIRELFNNPMNPLFVGGYFTSTKTQVEDQVRYAVRILNGASPGALPIGLHPMDYYFDWSLLHEMFPALSYSRFRDTYEGVLVNVPYYLENPGLFALWVGLLFVLIIAVIYGVYHLLIHWRWSGQMGLVEELQYEENVHDLMFSTAKDTIWMLRDNEFLLSPQFAYHFRLPSNILTVEQLEQCVHEDSKQSFEFLMNFREQRGKKSVRMHLSPDGGQQWYWAEVTYTATDESARTGELYGLLLNIDQKKQMEEQLEEAQALASQVALKENFLANISHDLRTPLGAVTGFSTMLTTPGMTFEEGEREQYAEIIHQNTDMILNMIDSVMEKAQAKTGDLEIIQRPVSVQKLVNDCYNTNCVIVPSHLQFLLEMDEPDETVNISMIRTKQVVNNFLSNAFKFTTEGSITLGWKHMEGNPDEIEVYVKDTGIGVEPEKQAQLFERYVKVDETDRGTGLGLNISKTIIERQGGTIGVESEIGKGSKFFFRLKRMVQCLLLVLTMGWGTLATTSCSKESELLMNERQARVLVIHSYEEELNAYREFNETLRTAFQHNGVGVDVCHLYLALKNPDEETVEKFLTLRDSLTDLGWSPDVMITEGDRAAHDFITWKEEGVVAVWDSVPVVLGALHHPEWSKIRKHKNLVVINDPIDYCANINLAVEMTGVNSVEIELDYFYQDSLIRAELRQALVRSPYIDNTDFHIAMEDSAMNRLQTDWKDSVMVLTYSVANPERNTVKDINTREQGYENLYKVYIHSWKYPSVQVKHDVYSSILVNKTRRPQFTAVKAGFADGRGRYLCGYFASYATVATDMANVASKILMGDDRSSLIDLTHKKGYYMDYQAMRRLDMKYRDYCDRFTIVGAPVEESMPFYNYLTWILIVGVFILGGAAVILVMREWKGLQVQDLVKEVKRRAEIRQMALHGADSRSIRTEDSLKDIISHIHPDYTEEIPLIMQAMQITGTHAYDICANIDEKYRWWQLRFVVTYEIGDQSKRVNGILINIDEAKKYEKDLRLALSLAEEARQKEDFLMTISHEIRTPLNAVVGFSDVIVGMPVDAFTPEELAEYAKIIKANNTSLSAMIEDILMFSRIGSGRIQYVKEVFDPAALIQEVIADWTDLVPEGVTLSMQTVRKDVMMDNDKTRVKYILNQLVSNAIKFTKRGYIIVGLDYYLNSDEVEFFIADTGCGIPYEKQEITFGLFWKDNGFIPGLGLGLHVAKKLADGMDLKLKVESKPGYGSKFSLYGDGFLKPQDGAEGGVQA